MHDESLYAQRALRAGARGYVTKHEASETVMIAIRRVLQGDVYLSDHLTARILKNLVDTGSEIEGTPINRLTDRELEVFQMIGHGRATRDIAKALNLGVKTVDTYRERIKQKLNLSNAAELHHQAIQWVSEAE
jgi:DNA-binding NarL/FixJ family response regulator